MLAFADTRRSPERFKTPPRRARGCRVRQRLSYGAVNRHNSSESIQMPGYITESKPTSIESLTEVTDAANSSASTSSANSSVSNISMEPTALANSLNNARALLKKKSLVQVINRYIKAGIEEGALLKGELVTRVLCKVVSLTSN